MNHRFFCAPQVVYSGRVFQKLSWDALPPMWTIRQNIVAILESNSNIILDKNRQLTKCYMGCTNIHKLCITRIIYIRFCSKSALLLHRIKNQNIEAKMKSRSWKPLAIYREKPEAYTEGAIWKAPPFGKNGEKKCHRIALRCWNIASIVRESGAVWEKVFLWIECF